MRAGPPRSLERAQSQDIGTFRPLDLPEPLHDELEVRRLDPRVSLRRSRTPASSLCLYERFRADPGQHGVDQIWLDGQGVRARHEDGEPLGGPEDRAASRVDGEAIELQPVGQQRGKPAFEHVEPRKRVLADRDEHVDRQLGTGHELGKRVTERRVAAVVDEVLLYLIEQQIELVMLRHRDLDRVGERPRVDEAAEATASASVVAGGPAQPSQTTTSESPASARRSRATAARTIELLPTPLGP